MLRVSPLNDTSRRATPAHSGPVQGSLHRIRDAVASRQSLAAASARPAPARDHGHARRQVEGGREVSHCERSELLSEPRSELLSEPRSELA